MHLKGIAFGADPKGGNGCAFYSMDTPRCWRWYCIGMANYLCGKREGFYVSTVVVLYRCATSGRVVVVTNQLVTYWETAGLRTIDRGILWRNSVHM